jgi:hypothetical protein
LQTLDVALVLHHFGELSDYGSTLVLLRTLPPTRASNRELARARATAPLPRLAKTGDDLVSDYRAAITPDCGCIDRTLAHRGDLSI